MNYFDWYGRSRTLSLSYTVLQCNIYRLSLKSFLSKHATDHICCSYTNTIVNKLAISYNHIYYTVNNIYRFFVLVHNPQYIIVPAIYVMYSGEYYAWDVTLSVYPHQASLKNMPDHGGNRTYDLWNTPTQKNHYWLLDYIDIEGTRFCSEISHIRTDLTA
jgi:hypothetical protein